MKNNQWNTLSTQFDTKKQKEIFTGAIDNLLIAGPELLMFIESYSPKDKKLRILEYGCGTGAFAHRLAGDGHTVIGVDNSSQMIKIAKKSYKDVEFKVRDSDSLSDSGTFDVITSIMTLQFIENVEKTIQNFSKILNKNGLLIFAVFNPQYIVNCLKQKIFFVDFDSSESPRVGFLRLETDVKIPTYVRSSKEYNAIAKKYKLVPLYEAYPPFTAEYLQQNPRSYPTKDSAYLILGYKKKD